MTSLYWQTIHAGYYASGPFTIKRSIYGSRQWIVREGERELGFRPTLQLAKGLAERNKSTHRSRAPAAQVQKATAGSAAAERRAS